MLTAARMNAPPTEHPIIRHSHSRRRCCHNAPPTWEYGGTTLSHSTTRVRCSLFWIWCLPAHPCRRCTMRLHSLLREAIKYLTVLLR